jgi:hypothetical protein
VAKQSQSWKDLERFVAKKFGGIRIVRGNDYSQTMLDVEHEWMALDAKWRSSLATVTWFKKLVKDNEKIYGKGRKVPVLVIKQKGMKGALVVIDIDDYIKVVNDKNYHIESKENENGEE